MAILARDSTATVGRAVQSGEMHAVVTWQVAAVRWRVEELRGQHKSNC